MTLCRRTLLSGLGVALAGMAAGAPARMRRQAPERLTSANFAPVLSGLADPEGVAATPDGRLFFSSGAGALGVRMPDGTVRQIGEAVAPNGVAIDRAGRAIVANMGLLKNRPGMLQRIDPATGAIETLVETLEGRALVASNGPVAARDGSLYCTHTSWGPVANIGTTTAAGFIYHVAPDGTAAIVARGLRGVNGLCLDAAERYLYASLTAEARIMRWPRHADGTLGAGEYYGPALGTAVPDQTVREILALPPRERATLGYCDGIAFDMAGNLWVTLPFANALVAITPDGTLARIVDDPEGTRLAMPTNLCWGGADRRTLYVVSRRAGTIIAARTRAAGLPLANWPAAR